MSLQDHGGVQRSRCLEFLGTVRSRRDFTRAEASISDTPSPLKIPLWGCRNLGRKVEKGCLERGWNSGCGQLRLSRGRGGHEHSFSLLPVPEWSVRASASERPVAGVKKMSCSHTLKHYSSLKKHLRVLFVQLEKKSHLLFPTSQFMLDLCSETPLLPLPEWPQPATGRAPLSLSVRIVNVTVHMGEPQLVPIWRSG